MPAELEWRESVSWREEQKRISEWAKEMGFTAPVVGGKAAHALFHIYGPLPRAELAKAVAGTSKDHWLNEPNLGKRTLDYIEKWLEDQGYTMRRKAKVETLLDQIAREIENSKNPLESAKTILTLIRGDKLE